MHNSPLWTSSDFAAPLPRGPGDSESLPTAQPFDIDVERRRPDHPVVAHVFGAIDLLTAPELRVCVDDHVDAPSGLVLDLSRVDFLAASGLTVLTDTDRRAGRDHLAWALVANTRPVLRPLEVLGLRDQLPTYDSVPGAVAAICAVTP
ncbi:STAS domain-containing protein [Actinophytocola sp.]|uniref:STAS domain-containing protein n=1 Tax=Actinophytocola sp. TaxID=1872138 RepID=UPI002ED8118F